MRSMQWYDAFLYASTVCTVVIPLWKQPWLLTLFRPTPFKLSLKAYCTYSRGNLQHSIFNNSNNIRFSYTKVNNIMQHRPGYTTLGTNPKMQRKTIQYRLSQIYHGDTILLRGKRWGATPMRVYHKRICWNLPKKKLDNLGSTKPSCPWMYSRV